MMLDTFVPYYNISFLYNLLQKIASYMTLNFQACLSYNT